MIRMRIIAPIKITPVRKQISAKCPIYITAHGLAEPAADGGKPATEETGRGGLGQPSRY